MIDYTTFLSLNFWHWRHGVYASNPRELEDYRDRWVTCPAEEYYGVPKEATFEPGHSPESNSRRIKCPSPRPCDFEANNQMVVDVFQSYSWDKAPCVILLHGFMSASDTGYRLWARLLNKQGCNVLFYHAPYHYARTPRGYISGELAVSADLIRLAEGIRQAVTEMRLILSVLKARGVPGAGLFGMSYGGWVSALTTGFDDFVKMLVLVEPIVDMEHVMWECLATRTMRRQLAGRGVPRELVAQLFKLVSAYERPARCPGKSILMLAGEYDKIAPAFAVRQLAQMWEGHFRQYRQGHVGYKLQTAGWRDMQELLLPSFLGR